MEKTRSVFKNIGSILLSVILTIAIFACGCLVTYYRTDPTIRSLQWVKEMVQKYYYREITDEEFLNATLSTVFGNGEKSLLDAYSTYYTPENYQSQSQTMAGNRTGAGMTYWMTETDTLIYRVFGNSAAENSGLRVGMYLKGYGTDAEHITYSGYTTEFSQFMGSREDGQPYVIVASTSPDEEGAVYELCNRPYKQNYVFYYDSKVSYRFTGEDALTPTEFAACYEFLPDDCAVIKLESFMGNAGEQMQRALTIFKEQGKNKLYLDLRNNGGGDMSVFSDICQYFCKEAPMSEFTTAKCVYRDGKQGIFTAEKNRYYDYFTDNTQIGILMNYNSASASEAFLGAMLDYRTMDNGDVYLAELDGKAKTYGKGIMQTTYVNPFTGEAIKLTTATLHWPTSDRCIHDVGFLPEDGAIALPCEQIVDINDGMLQQIVAK